MAKKTTVKKSVKAKKKKKAKKRKPTFVGKTSGVGILATWGSVFKENETLHLTDEQILSKMKKEFPGHAKRSKIFSDVKLHRRFYNSGKIANMGAKPRKKSKSYDK